MYADQVSNLKPGFRGYVFAVCNFQLAHGYALFSDTGIRNWATGYLALVVPTGTTNRNSTSVTYNPTTFTATLTPSSALAQTTTYTVLVHGGSSGPVVTDAAGEQHRQAHDAEHLLGAVA